MAEVENIVKAIPEEQDGEEIYMNSGSVTSVLRQPDRQVFVCYKSCLPGVEVEEGLLPQRFAKSFEDRKDDSAVVTELNVCDAGGYESDGDVLVFPEMVKYKVTEDTDVDAFVEDVLVNGKPWTSGIQQNLRGSFVFVCAQHKYASAFLDKFAQEIGSRGLSDQIFVKSCSPLSGHKFPGNLIVFSPDSALDVTGDWTLSPEDVPALINELIVKGEAEEQHIFPNGNGLVEQEPVGGCCQGANGVSCCQEDQTPFKEEEGSPKDPESVKKEEGSVKDSEPFKKEEGFVKLNRFRSMKKQERLLGAAAVGAVVTIAVAYFVYRRSG